MTPDKRITLVGGVMAPARSKIKDQRSKINDPQNWYPKLAGKTLAACRAARGVYGKEPSCLLKYIMVGIGGGLGSILRFWLGTYIGSKMGTRFPYGTFVINITGSFLIGLVFALLTVRTHWSVNWRYLIPIGFIGGYTTFSSFEFETLRTLQDGQIGLGLLYVMASVVVGLVAVCGGMIAGRAIV